MSIPAIPAIVLGATGYVGGELLRLIAGHPQFTLLDAVSTSQADNPIDGVFASLRGQFPGQTFATFDQALGHAADASRLAVFSAAPHGAAAALVQQMAQAGSKAETHIVDVSADFRYSDVDAYEAVYQTAHGAPQMVPDFFCGLPEHSETPNVPHVGHPGCFATALLLAIVPLMSSGLTDTHLFASGITGSTGSGRQPQGGTHHPERHSNLYAYKSLDHRHVPEVKNLVYRTSGKKADVHFVPHSGPFARGIYVTVQARTSSNTSTLYDYFADLYASSPFVDVVRSPVKLKNVTGSNRCEIGITVNNGTVAINVAIDNLLKGAAGGAMQWMNRLFDLPEESGLQAAGLAWT